MDVSEIEDVFQYENFLPHKDVIFNRIFKDPEGLNG